MEVSVSQGVSVLRYRETRTDRMPLPRSFFTERRYRGHDGGDTGRPFAHYFDESLRPLQPHAVAALAAGPVADRGYPPEVAAARLSAHVPYVDELIGPQLAQLAIRFFDPALAGFPDRAGTTVIAARVGSSEVPVASGWLFHQVRATERGSEMRSRFFRGYPQILDLPVRSSAKRVPSALLATRLGRRLLRSAIAAQVGRDVTDAVARDLLAHGAAEMNHLAHILPRLHGEFGRRAEPSQ